jgi:hypothetical protein
MPAIRNSTLKADHPQFSGRDGVVLHGVGFAQLRGLRFVAEEAHVVRTHLADRRHAIGIQRDGAGGGVVGIGPHHLLQAALQLRAFGRTQGGPAVGTAFARPCVQDRHRLAMQPVRAPVRGDVTAVAPDRAQLHAADGLPDLAAALDVGAGVDDAAVLGHHLFRHRRGRAEDLAARPQQHCKR